MSLRKSTGNMYDWVTHMWSPIVGCPHRCAYCYVRSRGRDQPAEASLKNSWPNLGRGRTIFVAHLADLFAVGVPRETICMVLGHCGLYPENKYVFQTKDPYRLFSYLHWMPPLFMIGTTIETNRQSLLNKFSQAPPAQNRALAMNKLPDEKFLTIEPIMDFDLKPLIELVLMVKPAFVNIGADSKGHHLPEPSRTKVLELIARLQEQGVTIRKKSNLERLTG